MSNRVGFDLFETESERMITLTIFNDNCFIYFVPSSVLDGTTLSLSPYLREYKESGRRL